MRHEHTRIFVMTNTAKHSGREILRGILRFATGSFDWRVHVCEPTVEGENILLEALSSGQVDGIITSEMENPSMATALETAAVPLVVIGTRRKCIPSRTRNVVFVTHDEESLGASAARYLCTLGKFSSCGYVYARGAVYRYLSELREKGFRAVMSARGQSVEAYRPAEENVPDYNALGRWLLALRKPACVLAAYDKIAADVIYACERVGIAIPEQVRLIGIDNDEYTCLSTSPNLSSVATDAEQEGHTAATQLNRLIHGRGKRAERRIILCRTTCEIVPRESTRVLSPGLDIVRRARAYISANASRAVKVDDVVAFLHISRGLAYLRFREYARKSILETINDARIEFVKLKLKSSRQTIDSVARSCGFANPNHLKTLFKRKTGLTMREWRARNAHQAPRK